MTSPDLEQLAERGLLNPVLSQFLRACVLAGKNIIIAGGHDSGRSTLLGALAAVAPARERVLTVTVDGTGQLHGADSSAGNIHPQPASWLGQAMYYNVNRVIVDHAEDESAVALLHAMASGRSGSMGTFAAPYPYAVIDQLTRAGVEGGSCLSEQGAHQLIGDAVDLLVYLDTADTSTGRRRFVTHVHEIHPSAAGGPPVFIELFAPVLGQMRAILDTEPTFIKELQQHGFEKAWLHDASRTWGQW
ncbi:hypothetical protein ABCR94_14050 [Streptomyces sp. 21So2-11]|uniref:hypothetical protein n=1 Tax=Streptomyces sp. 21So2-11 TaxID=3144408 RepID=UPI00321AAABA